MNKNLSTQMAELRSILATIENKSLNEDGPKAKIGKEFLDILAGKSAGQLVKQVSTTLGKKFEVTVLVKNNVVDASGKATTTPVKSVYEHVDGTETYKIIEVAGKDISEQGIIIPVADVVKKIEQSIAQEQVVKPVVKQAVKPFNASAEAEATAKAEKLSIAELEKKIASKEGTALEQKAYAKELADKKAAAPKTDTPRDPFDTANSARESAKKMTPDQLEKAIKDMSQSPVARKEFAAELERRGKAAPKAADDATKTADDAAPKAADDGTKTGADVLIKKENEKAMADAKQALDDGTVKVKENELLPKKANETPAEQVERTLKEDPRYADKYDSIQNTGGVAKLWNWIKEHKTASIVVALAVALAGRGGYLKMTRDEAEKQNDAEVANDTPVVPAETAEEKKKREEKEKNDAIAADEKTEAEKVAAAAAAEAEKTDGKTTDGKTTDGKTADGKTADGGAAKVTGGEQDAELAKLKAQIDALIAELSKSKDPAILKRLEIVKAKLGLSGQSAKTAGPEAKGEWRNVGQDYERWYGPKGRDAEGTEVYNGMVRTIPYDAGQEDEFAKLDHPELVRMLVAYYPGQMKELRALPRQELLRKLRVAARQSAVKK